MKKGFLVISSSLLFLLTIFGQETKMINQNLLSHYPLSKVDKRVELLSIVFRMAGNFDYNDDVDLVKAGMGNQHYTSWQTMMNESLVRASVIRYLLKHNPDGKDAKYQLISDFGSGFFWMKCLVDTLGAYEKNRAMYPTLESYLPVLADFYNRLDNESEAMFEIKK